MPVEALASNTSTISATIMMLMPLMPDLDKPRIKAAAVTVKISIRLRFESIGFKSVEVGMCRSYEVEMF